MTATILTFPDRSTRGRGKRPGERRLKWLIDGIRERASLTCSIAEAVAITATLHRVCDHRSEAHPSLLRWRLDARRGTATLAVPLDVAVTIAALIDGSQGDGPSHTA